MSSNDLWILFGWFKVRIVRPPVLYLYLGPTLEKTFQLSEGSGTVDINLGDNQFTNVHVTGKDAAGLPSAVALAWACDHPEFVTITPDATGANCRIEAAAPPVLGTAVVTATDAADPSIAPLVFNVIVSAESVVNLGVVVDPPQEKP